MVGFLNAAYKNLEDRPKRYIVEGEYNNVHHTWIDFESDVLNEAFNRLTELQALARPGVIYTILDRGTQRRIYVTDVAAQSA